MALAPGTRLGAYEILSLLGSGGMGEVYRAKDTKLGRDVALKILPDTFTHDPERLARFRREAQVLASLNHPHIGAIYGLNDANGTQFLVLELVDGESLDRRIARGPIPIDEALGIAKQIAEALEGAHEKGIIHRDLKPANIAITRDGTVKVLDFGLAKATEAASGPSIEVTNSPTITTPAMMTGVGMILGTAAYMSPEQAKGRPADKRSDVWAFGCVLFEALTGRRAFDGESISETTASVIRDEPIWTLLPSGTPARLMELLRRCLQKDPARRLRDIGDGRLELDDLVSGRIVEPARAAGTNHWAWIATLLGVALLAALAFSRLAPLERPAVVRFSYAPEHLGGYYNIAVSPDGQRIAATHAGEKNTGEVSLRAVDSMRIDTISAAQNSEFPFWSPDGKWLATFGFEGKLKKTNLAGGPPEILADERHPLGGTWNAKGDILYGTPAGLYRAAADGRALAKVETNDGLGATVLRGYPSFLPDGDHFLYLTIRPSQIGTLWVASLTSHDTRRLLNADSKGEYAAPGFILFARGGTLMAQPFDARTLTVGGDAVAIEPQIASGWNSAELSTGNAAFSVSRQTLAFAPVPARTSRHVWYERDGRELGALPVPETGEYLNPSLSPDGKRIAMNRIDPVSGNWDIWIIDVDRNAATRFTSDPAQDSDPVWSPDGQSIVFASMRNNRFGLYQKRADGSAGERLVNDFDAPVTPTSWSPDGRYIVYTATDIGNVDSEIWALPLDGTRKPFPVVRNGFFPYGAQISPDGKWIAFASNETGTQEVYVQSFPSAGAKFQVSNGGPNIHPRWRRDGKEIFYWNANAILSPIIVSDIHAANGTIVASKPKPAIAAPVQGLSDARNHYAVTADGMRVLIRRDSQTQSAPIQVVINWQEELRARAPAR